MKTKKTIIGVSLLYLTLYVPTAFMAYSPLWYDLNCMIHPGCKYIGNDRASKYIDELTDFFLHLGELASGWTTKEKIHLGEVRNILDVLAIAAIVLLLLLVITLKPDHLWKYAKINMVIVLSLIVVVPFFEFFWVKIFHPLLFSNDFWRNNPWDYSYHIIPEEFFISSIIFLIVCASGINGLLYFAARRLKDREN